MPTSDLITVLVLIAVLSVAAAVAICSHHMPRIRSVVDGVPPGPPYTATTETDDSWLRELPAREQRRP